MATPFPELNAVLEALVAGARAILGVNFTGAYLQGSFAMGDSDIHSDVDFLIVVNQDLSAGELPALQALHGQIYDLPTPWAQHLEGSYFPKDLLRWGDPIRRPLWYLDNTSRELIRSDHDNTLVVRWTLREYGIPLAGPAAATLVDPVPVDDLRREVIETMRTWGQELLDNPEKMNNRWYQPFAVLSYCRMLQTLATGRIHSKPAGAAWARSALDPRWDGLIRRAWEARPDPSVKVRQPADPAELAATQEFIRYALSLASKEPS